MAEKLLTWAHEASFVLWILIGMSIVTLGLGLERLSTITRNRKRLAASRQALGNHLDSDSHAQAAALALVHSDRAHVASDLLVRALEANLVHPRALVRAQASIVRLLRRRIWLLGTIGNLAPFVGLLGTVLGVMDAFVAIGQTGGGGFDVVSAGISEALRTTAAGIFVGIEAVLLFNFLQTSVAHYTAELKDTLEELLEGRDAKSES